jgi:hypothetical protein
LELPNEKSLDELLKIKKFDPLQIDLILNKSSIIKYFVDICVYQINEDYI